MLSIIRELDPYKQLLADLKDGVRLDGLGLPRAARLLILAALQEDLNVPILFITDRTDRALTYLDELGFWTPQFPRNYFPEPTPMFYEPAAWGTVTRRDRLHALTVLSHYHMPGVQKPARAPILVAPIRAVMTKTLPRRDFLKSCQTIKIGQQIQPETLQRAWVEFGYQAAEIVLEPGQFSRRGGLLDIWPPAETNPVRIDFFGDEVDTLRLFDPATQRTAKQLERVLITPAREILLNKISALGLPTDDLDEFSIPRVYPMPSSVLDYLPQHALIIIDDLDSLQVVSSDIEEQAVKIRKDSLTEGTLSADYPPPYFSWSEIFDMLSGHTWVEMGRSTAKELPELASLFSLGKRFGGQLKSLMETLMDYCQAGDQTVIASRQNSRLKELWTDRCDNKNDRSRPVFVNGTFGEGWNLLLPTGKQFHFITDSEIFGWERPKPRQRRRPIAESPETIYADLKPGDWVVHIDYGIGRYAGLLKRVLEGTEREFLCVEYDQGDQLFVPVHQADRLSRYIGPDGTPPNLTRLGTPEWSSAKQRVREAIVEIAHELLELYALRQVAKGFSFSPDSTWQQELEASFPYIETDDQLRAIAEVKKDMESVRPMDRLLCGDVGYGKTEVALRAAFKAVMDGKQVAVLVPTTVLAQQHFDTFKQRLAAYPVEVEMLSRFRTAKEQDRILKKLSEGGVDILIGTHRMVQADVRFKDLGLVVIDEEQRFGVTHKEFLKKLRTEVDVLTMTATPIPRTLYMALTGVRDISTINTPPEERLPIITHVGPYSPRLVRQAILREIERGGQVFFVHNRVQTIRAMEMHICNLVPEARVGIAHGQMPEGELSKVMHLFSRGDLDVLLCTSIIESGLDIPNANTLIVDRGDTFGLAQLYQLRGRVGRGAQRAYAYFFRHRRKSPTPEGMERLEVIAENSQLGAGYSIAMRDLEMRGAGELLGTHQHGYIASVGFHLYTRLLGQAVKELRLAQGLPASGAVSLEQAARLPVSVDLPLSIGIPGDYIADQNMRLKLYRRMANLHSDADLNAIEEELLDRFGAFPDMLKNLFFQMRAKILGEEAGLSAIVVENHQLVLKYPPLPDNGMVRSLKPIGHDARIGKNAYWMPMDENDSDWRDRLLSALSAIINS